MRRDETILQHLGEEKNGLSPVTPPIYQTSLFVHPTVESFSAGIDPGNFPEGYYTYSRMGNPNCSIVEKKIAALENAERSIVFANGMAAVSSALMNVLSAGDHVVVVDTSYGPTKSFVKDYLPKFGVSSTFVTGNDPNEIESAILTNTKAVYLESPSSILYRIQDLEAISSIAKSRGITTLIDNSYASPWFQKPHNFGIDLVVHSATKYLGGHSDILAGCVSGKSELMASILANEAQFLGTMLAPFPSWLLMRGMRTLKLRMIEAQSQGNLMFNFLNLRSEIEQVFHVGDPDHPQSNLIKKQMSGTSSLLTFVPKVQSLEKITAFMEALRVFQMGVSWGGFESLVVGLPMQPMDWDQQKWVVRLYIGLESIEDLIEDLENALVHLK